VNIANPIQRTFFQFGKDLAFERRSSTLYGRNDEVVTVSNLQRSQYGPRYYVNQAFWLKELGDVLYPKAYQCHVMCRLESLFPEKVEMIGRLLDLEYDIPDELRSEDFRSVLTEHLLPFIKRGSVNRRIEGPLQRRFLEIRRD
jgi:hypothetical protein